MKRLHYLQHVPFENPGCIIDWANSNDVELQSTHLYKDEPLPALQDFDLLVVMGGAMGANDDGLFPWMAPEKKFIESAKINLWAPNKQLRSLDYNPFFKLTY